MATDAERFRMDVALALSSAAHREGLDIAPDQVAVLAVSAEALGLMLYDVGFRKRVPSLYREQAAVYFCLRLVYLADIGQGLSYDFDTLFGITLEDLWDKFNAKTRGRLDPPPQQARAEHTRKLH